MHVQYQLLWSIQWHMTYQTGNEPLPYFLFNIFFLSFALTHSVGQKFVI